MLRPEPDVNVTREVDPGVKMIIGSVFNSPHIFLFAMEVVYVFDWPIASVSGIVKLATQLVSRGVAQLLRISIGFVKAIRIGKLFAMVSDNVLLAVSDNWMYRREVESPNGSGLMVKDSAGNKGKVPLNEELISVAATEIELDNAPTVNVPTETCIPVSVAVIVGSVMRCFAADCVFT